MVSLHWPPPPSMVIPLLLLLVLPAITYGQATPAEILKQFDGCPIEDARKIDGCDRLKLNKTNEVVCPHNLWWGQPQLIYHSASNTTSVTTVWNPTKRVNLAKGVELWKAECEICPGDNQLLPGGKVICSIQKNIPEVSLEPFIEQIWVGKVDDTFCVAEIRDDGKFSWTNCWNGNCIQRKTKLECQCYHGWRGKKCDEAYDPFGYDNSGQQVTRYPTKPEHAVEDKCNILLAEGCPDEAKDDCVKLRFVQDKQQQQFAYCPRKLWLSTDSKWEQIDNLLCENEQWKIARKSSSNGTFLEPRRRIRCAHTQPAETSVALQFSTLGMLSFGQGDLSTFFCFHNHLKCEHGGHCMHSIRSGEVTKTYCSCDCQYTGPHCEIYDLINLPLNLLPLLILDGCPIEAAAASNCQRLSLAGGENGWPHVMCPLKLWRNDITQTIYHEASKTTSVTTTWIPVEKVARLHDKWWFKYNDPINWIDESYNNLRKVICSSEKPNNMSMGGFSKLTWGVRVNESSPLSFCPENLMIPGKECKHGYCISNTMRHLGCQCHFGWSGELCDIALDPFGYEQSVQPVARYTTVPDHVPDHIRDRCNILLAEGCPDETTDDCIKLRLLRDAKRKLQAFCPRKLWLSSADNAWALIDDLWCDWSLAKWKTEIDSTASVLEPRSRVRCAHTLPKGSFPDLERATLVQHSFGFAGLSSTFFCFRNHLKCENGAQCLHTLRKNEPAVAYCACGPQYSGDRCEEVKPLTADFPSCSPLLVDGCASEANDALGQEGGRQCEKLVIDAVSMSADCKKPNELWVSDVRLVYSSFSKTHSRSSKWTQIDKLSCKDNKWEISWNGQNGANEKATLTLARKVICSSVGAPKVDADAFWEHRSFVPTTANFAQVKPTPLAFCPNEVRKVCPAHSSYCVISYEKEQFVPSCYCNYGYTGDYCNDHIDPHGFERYRYETQVQQTEQDPDAEMDTCNILGADGCADINEDRCRKLRYYDSGVICRYRLWVWRTRDIWDEIHDLRCTEKGWKVILSATNSSAMELLNHKSRVKCSWAAPSMNATEDWFDYGRVWCAWKQSTCDRGHCFVIPGGPEAEELTGKKHIVACACVKDFKANHDWVGERCDQHILEPDAKNRHDIPEDDPLVWSMGASPRRRGGAHLAGQDDLITNTVESCDTSDLEDGCNDKRCKKLKANSTHVKCTKQLWLNYGSEFWLDWHEISGVKCVNNMWITECSKKIGQSHLVCSSSRPSPISSHLWMLIGVVGFLVILAIGLTCVICLICRRRRKFAQALADARTPHTSRCASSTQNSEMTTREE